MNTTVPTTNELLGKVRGLMMQRDRLYDAELQTLLSNVVAHLEGVAEVQDHARWVARLFGTGDARGKTELAEHVAQLRNLL
jgi:hypothetical protein